PSTQRQRARTRMRDEERVGEDRKRRRTSAKDPGVGSVQPAHQSKETRAQGGMRGAPRTVPFAVSTVGETETLSTGGQLYDGEAVDSALEYDLEVFAYTKELELRTLPRHDGMAWLGSAGWGPVDAVVDWMIQLHGTFCVHPETLFLAVNILHRFLSVRVFNLSRLPLVAIACILIGTKVEENVAPSLDRLLKCIDAPGKETMVVAMEIMVLRELGWNMSFPSPVYFFRRVSSVESHSSRTLALGEYLLAIGCVE
ncbi:cyclin-like protein, partial [Schizophyllum commune]